ncbi:MAG: hypothetical protein D6754_11560, partial [Alphaproteobacteria bacterium]
SFDNVLENIVVPFDAIVTFVDPSVEFGLRFDQHDAEDDREDDHAEGEDERPDDDGPDPGGDVVSLDRFRRH